MSTAIVKYTGSYRTECMHVRSGKTVETDPPLDNQGLGEAFSPTDLLGRLHAHHFCPSGPSAEHRH